MNIRKAYHRWISALLVFIMVFTMVPIQLFQSSNSTAYAAGSGYVGDSTGNTGMTTGLWRANWGLNQQGVRISIVDNDGNIMLNGKWQAIDIIFSDPENVGATRYFNSIKFQDYNVNNTIYEIPVGILNNKLIEAINSGPSSELLTHLQGTLKGTPDNIPYPSNVKTMPRPIEYDQSKDDWVANGDEVKKFFIDGKLGSFSTHGYYISANKLMVATGNTGSGSSSTPSYTPPAPSNKTENTSSVTNTSNTNLIQSPYGNVTYDWLRNHFMNTSYRSSQEAYDSGFMTTTEKRALVHKLESAQSQFRLLTSTAIDDNCNLTQSEFNEGIETIYNRFNILAASYYSGSVTYEYLRVANAELRTMANSAKSLYKTALSVAENHHMHEWDKQSVLAVYEDWASGGTYYITSDFININEVILGDIVGYNTIPLAYRSLDSDNILINPAVNYSSATLFKDEFLRRIYEDFEKDTTAVVMDCLKYVYKEQAESIGNNYAASSATGPAYGNPEEGSVRGLAALAIDILNICITFNNGKANINTSNLVNFFQENIESKMDIVTQTLRETQFNNMLNMGANKQLAADQAMAEFGMSHEELVTAAHVKEQLIPQILNVIHADGFTDITYEDILSIMDGETEEEKLNIAANKINTLGLDGWLKTLNISSLLGVGGGLDLGAISNSKGYIYALLDIKDNSGDYAFDIHIPEEKQSEFESVAADPTSPAQKFMYMGYGIVIEPIVWYAPVSSTSGYEESDVGKTDPEGRFLYRAKRLYYMTPTSFARYQMANQSKHWYLENGHLSLGRLFPTSMYIDEDITYFQGGEKDDGIIQGLPESAKLTVKGITHRDVAPKVYVKNMDADTFGYGWHFSSGTQQESTLQVTWNDTVPSPGEAPDPTPLPDPSKGPDGNPWDPSDPDYPYTDYPNGYPDKHFNIIKYYEVWDYSDPSNPTPAERYGPTIREQNPNIIRVVDEPEFKVEDWYTTALNGNLPEENNTDEIYSTNSAKDIHVQDAPTGNKVATVTMDKQNDGSEDTLVVQLVKKINQQQLPPGQGAITIQQSQITKAIRTNNVMNGGAPWGNYKFDLAIGEFLDEHTRRHIDCYCPGHGNKEDGYWSHSSPCRHKSEKCSLAMPGLDGDTDITFKFRGIHTVSFGNGLEVGNKNNQLKPLIYSNGSGNDVSTHDFTLNSLSKKTFKFTGDGEALQGEEYVTVLWRYKDVPTIPLYKKADIESMYGVDHWNIPDSILPSNQKIPDKKRLSNGDNIYSLSINFGVDLAISDIRAVASCLSSDSSGDCGASTGCTYKDPRDAFTENGTNWTYMFNAQTKVRTWRGVVSNKSFADEKMIDGNTEKIQKRSFNTHFETTMVEDAQTIKFYPYIKMTYMTNDIDLIKSDENGGPGRQTTYVFSEHESSFLPNDAIEVGWTNPNEKGSLNIVSQQWSLHKRATDNGKAWNGANQVLPGGAIYQLVVPEAKTDVKIVTYQTVVDSETRTWLSANLTGDEYTETQVMNEHKQFVDTAVDVLDKLRVVQWVNKNFNATYAWPDNWDENAATTQVCVRGGGIDLTKLGLSHKSNTETKYYMQKFDFGSPASEGDLDILMKKQITTVFKAFTDTEGNVYVAKTDNAGSQTTDVAALVARMKDLNYDTMAKKSADIEVAKVANKNDKWQDINGKLTGEFKQIDDRTKIITNVVKSLERNTGNDTTAAWAKQDGKWYNEAFDGIYLVRQATTLTVGFQDPLKRAAALDPALCPENKGESDLYSNAFLSQFCMNDKSDSPLAAGKDSRYLGTFKGNDIQLPEMQGLYQTRKFYIPNVNVQDLN